MGFENPSVSGDRVALFEEKAFLGDEKFPTPNEYVEKLVDSGHLEHAKAYEKVLEFSKEIKKRGGRALLVGGSVRDHIMGKVAKDFDIEVYGLLPQKVEEVVKMMGKFVDAGRSFGILKVTLEGGIDLDISIPRTDSKIGVGHRGFEVKTDPFMSIKEGAKRRDFTMNSLCADPISGEIFDPWGGIEDIKRGVLKVTDEERFKDDPLRVLRAIQFIGRFGLKVDKNSIQILQEMAPLVKELPKLRIKEEWKKLLLKSEKPSLGLSAGMTLGLLEEIHPELALLEETEQDPLWHPEGDAWIHTLMSVDQAAKIVQRENLESESALTIFLSVICHDLGKIVTTEPINGQIKSHGHEQAGEKPARIFLETIGIENRIKEKVVRLVKNHLIPSLLYIQEVVRKNKVSDGAIRNLANRIHPSTIQELVLVAEVDHLGRGVFDSETKEDLLLPPEWFPAGEWLLERARKIEVDQSRPADLTRGRQWQKLGFEQGPIIGELIRISNALRDEKKYTREMVFQAVDKIEDPKEIIMKLEECLK